jgi:uracil-DNA glycosylase family 4
MNKREALNQLHEDWKNCKRCELYKGRIQEIENKETGEIEFDIVDPTPGYGNVDAEIMAIGSKVGHYEGVAGAPMQGPVGEIYDSLLKEAGLSREKIWTTNVTNCRILQVSSSTGNVWTIKDPSAKQIQSCAPRLSHEISIIKPKLIVMLGRLVAKYFLNRVPTRKRWVEDYTGPFRLYFSINPAAAKEGRERVESRYAEMVSHWREIAEWVKENKDG